MAAYLLPLVSPVFIWQLLERKKNVLHEDCRVNRYETSDCK